LKKMTVFTALLAALVLLFCSCSFADAPVQSEGIVIPVMKPTAFEIPRNEATEFVRDMKAGWNLGNTFDAYDDIGWFEGTGADMEIAWVKTKTTPYLIETIHEAGFNTMRLPVSWHNHVDGQYRIDPVWMSRVREVADYALSRGMYVIVNIHHDDGEKWIFPDSAHYENSAAYLKTVWLQIADAFADCDQHLIMEALNEPRLVGTPYEWSLDLNDSSCQDAANCINRLNQLFVDTVRSTGGNNADRFLMVSGYTAGPWHETDPSFVVPKDTVKDRLIISAHAYSPYSFTLQENSGDTVFTLDSGSKDKQDEINGVLDSLYWTFVARGIPVVMGEFGSSDRNGNLQDRVNYTAWYIASASARGIPCIIWDNHVFEGNGDAFGLIDRNTCKWVHPDIVLAMIANATLSH